MLLQLRKALEDNEAETCVVYRMSPTERRRRGVDANGEVTNLYQGEAPVPLASDVAKGDSGDRAMRDDNTVTVQIHRLDLQTQENNVVAQERPSCRSGFQGGLRAAGSFRRNRGQPDRYRMDLEAAFGHDRATRTAA